MTSLKPDSRRLDERRPRPTILGWTCPLLLLGGLAVALEQQPPTRALDSASSERLEVIEDLSESLANDLLELSVAVRDRDLAGVREFFPERLAGAAVLPAEPEPVEDTVKWVSKHGWQLVASEPGEATREELIARLSDFLGHFAEIEDARFKVKDSVFDASARTIPGAREPTAAPGATGRVRVAFFVVGRDQEGRREWARGSAQARVEQPAEGPWRFLSFETTALDSMIATAELFSEVSVPAGVGTSLPAFGSPGSGGFIWHGAAAGDLDGDGWIDLFVTAADRNYLYLNGGNGRFEDASEVTGVALLASGVAPLLLDYDNDGDLDVFLSAVGPQVLLENRLHPDGELGFWDVSLEAGVAVPAVGFSAAAADLNADGRPDIYVASYNRYGEVTPDSWFRGTNGTPNRLFVSQPGGGFREQGGHWGVDDARWSYAAAFADVNEDGRPDLYVANDFGENALYVHRGERFADESEARGVLDPGNGMGVAFGDYNNDGRLDLHVTNMSSTAGTRILARLFPGSSHQDNVLVKLASGSNLYENLGQGRYRDVTTAAGGFSGGWAWGGGFIDLDNDGWEDLFTPNGFISGKSMKDT